MIGIAGFRRKIIRMVGFNEPIMNQHIPVNWVKEPNWTTCKNVFMNIAY